MNFSNLRKSTASKRSQLFDHLKCNVIQVNTNYVCVYVCMYKTLHINIIKKNYFKHIRLETS